ncbi:hypothetical protein V9T40_001441 [Parthenolecanium corni]|uniref:Ankyrin repeat domain-containing protein n=1 Tax=Parthenolecanium corni TaxID=536013 RepID=A0AAN9TY87_9HEMI
MEQLSRESEEHELPKEFEEHEPASCATFGTTDSFKRDIFIEDISSQKKGEDGEESEGMKMKNDVTYTEQFPRETEEHEAASWATFGTTDSNGRNIVTDKDLSSQKKKEDGEESEAITKSLETEEFPLHESIFHNNYAKMVDTLKSGYNVKMKDKHGNTALHLAVMLGRKSFVETLLDYKASVRTRNLLGWSSVDEAVSYRDEETVKLMVRRLTEETREEFIQNRRDLLDELKTIPDFYMELKWEIRSVVPGLSYVLPSDLCKIRRRGLLMRMDWSAIDFTVIIIRGHVAVIFDGAASPHPSVHFLNVKKKEFMRIDSEEEHSEIEVTIMAQIRMKEKINFFTASTSNFSYTRKKKTSWLGAESDLTETVGQFEADIYEVDGLVAKLRERSEHLGKKEDDKVKDEGKTDTSAVAGKADDKEKTNTKNEKSLPPPPPPPPPPTHVTWKEYINAEPGMYPTLARKIDQTEHEMQLPTSIVGMVPTFPLTKAAFTKILQVIAPFKQFNKLREFMDNKLPPGFPVRLEIPIKLGISAKVSILKFQTAETLSEEVLHEDLFKIPKDYEDYEEKQKKKKEEKRKKEEKKKREEKEEKEKK